MTSVQVAHGGYEGRLCGATQGVAQFGKGLDDLHGVFGTGRSNIADVRMNPAFCLCFNGAAALA